MIFYLYLFIFGHLLEESRYSLQSVQVTRDASASKLTMIMNK